MSIKQTVDEQHTPGRFLLTGSASALLLSRLSDSLAGRMESVRLMTLSECEIQGRQPIFLGAAGRGDSRGPVGAVHHEFNSESEHGFLRSGMLGPAMVSEPGRTAVPGMAKYRA